MEVSTMLKRIFTVILSMIAARYRLNQLGKGSLGLPPRPHLIIGSYAIRQGLPFTKSNSQHLPHFFPGEFAPAFLCFHFKSLAGNHGSAIWVTNIADGRNAPIPKSMTFLMIDLPNFVDC